MSKNFFQDDKTISKSLRRMLIIKREREREVKRIKFQNYFENPSNNIYSEVEQSRQFKNESMNKKLNSDHELPDQSNDYQFSLQEIQSYGECTIQNQSEFRNNLILNVNDIQNQDIFIKFNNFIVQIQEKLKNKQYYLTKYITCGGQGAIFEGFQEFNEGEKQNFIFKIYFEYSKEDFEEELIIMKAFENNINIIQLIDFIQIEDDLYILVLEKCKYSLYEELKQIANNSIKFTQSKLLQIIFNLLDGLIQLRIYNIIHLDIKPQNILVSNSGNYLYTDFGASQKYDENKQVKIKAFTQRYASEEQILKGSVNFQTDVFSLGMTLNLVIQVFKKENNEDKSLIDRFEQIVNKYMIQQNQLDRGNCLQLHEIFFQTISNLNINFREDYFLKIEQIISKNPYDLNKDTKYFQQLKTYYLQLQLKIIQKFTDKEITFQSALLNILNDLAISYIELNDSQNALKYSLSSLEIGQQFFRGNHPDISVSLNLVGQCYKKLGNIQNYIKYSLQSLEMSKQLFQGNHEYIAGSLNNVGDCYIKLGDPQNAFQYLFESLEMRIQLYQGIHPDIASSLNNVGAYYSELGDFQKALKFSLESLDMSKKIIKGIHPKIIETLNSVGIFYQELHEYQKALKYTIESLEMQKKLFKGKHPNIARSLNQVGQIYGKLDDSQNAFQYSVESLEMQKQIFKGNHVDIAGYLNNVGQFYSQLGDSQNALKYSLESLQMRKQLFQGIHPQIDQSLFDIGLYYSQINNFQNALKYSIESLEMRKQLISGNHPKIAQSLNNVGAFYSKLGDSQNTFLYLLESLEMKKQLFKGNHPEIASSLNNVGRCCQLFGDYQNALKYSLKSLKMRKQLFKGNHPDINSSLKNLVFIYLKLGDFQNALKYSFELLEI